MAKKTALDVTKLKLTVVSEDAVPAATPRQAPYREILKGIKKGTALMFSSEDVNLDSMRGGVRRLQRRGEFKHIIMRTAIETNGVKKLYLWNPSDKVKEV